MPMGAAAIRQTLNAQIMCMDIHNERASRSGLVLVLALVHGASWALTYLWTR